MAAMTNIPEGNLLASQQFAQIMRHYIEASDAVRGVINSMCTVINDPAATLDEKDMAVRTLAEALFPSSHDGEPGIDIDALREVQSCTADHSPFSQADREEALFSQRLESVMKAQSVTQTELATRLGIQQSAIAMMLQRACRPQRRTVKRMAEALGVAPTDLWPGFRQSPDRLQP